MEFDKGLLEEINESLMSGNETICIAESVTSGLLQVAFSEMINSKLFYKGGITVHTPDKIVKLLKVDIAEIKNCNCVSSFVADTMGRHASKIFESEWCIATSGTVPRKETRRTRYLLITQFYTKELLFSLIN